MRLASGWRSAPGRIRSCGCLSAHPDPARDRIRPRHWRRAFRCQIRGGVSRRHEPERLTLTLVSVALGVVALAASAWPRRGIASRVRRAHDAQTPASLWYRATGRQQAADLSKGSVGLRTRWRCRQGRRSGPSSVSRPAWRPCRWRAIPEALQSGAVGKIVERRRRRGRERMEIVEERGRSGGRTMSFTSWKRSFFTFWTGQALSLVRQRSWCSLRLCGGSP